MAGITNGDSHMGRYSDMTQLVYAFDIEEYWKAWCFASIALFMPHNTSLPLSGCIHTSWVYTLSIQGLIRP